MRNGKWGCIMIKLYTIDCPKCKVLETKLKGKGMEYETITDKEIMKAKGMVSAPYIELAGGELMDFTEAIKWLREQDSVGGEVLETCESCNIT